jgi:aminoglycoside phosphotransferase (APT) family kinase protein
VLGEIVGAGRSADVHAIDARRVVKLYRPGRERVHIEREMNNARAAHAADLPAPAVGELIERDGRAGLVFERIYGTSLLDAARRTPSDIPRLARAMARLQADIHGTTAATLPWQVERLAALIRGATAFMLAEQRALLDTLYRLPLGRSVCHGDLVPANVIATDGGLVAVDWFGASQGNPLGCVASTSLKLAREGEGRTVAFKRAAYVFREAYLDEYFAMHPQLAPDLPVWETVVAASLTTTIGHEPEVKRLCAIARRGLARGA